MAEGGPVSGTGVLRRGVLAGSAAAVALAVAACGRTSAAGAAASGPVNSVTAFGAKGDGSTDDAAAVQQAIDHATASGGQVTFPPGKYFLGKGLTAGAPIRLSGEAGQGGCTLEFASTVPVCLSLGQSTNKPPFPGPRLELCGLGFHYGGTGSVVHIDESKVNPVWQDTLIERCLFYVSGGGVAVQSINQRSTIITMCSFFGSNSGVGVQLTDTDNAKIIDNVFYNLNYGIQGVRGPQRVFDAGCLIVGNDLYGATNGLHFSYWELVQAIGNIIDGCDIPMNLNDCYHSIIDGNYLGGYGSGPVLNIYTTNGSPGEIVVRGNYLNNYQSKSGATASVQIAGADSGTPVQYLALVGNVINGYPTYGIHLKNTSHCSVRDNMLVQGGGTLSLAIYDSTPGDARIEGNDVPHNSISAKGDVLRYNRGYETEAAGSVTLPAGQSSVHVPLSLAVAPEWVTATPTANVGAVWVTGISASGFDVHVAAPSAGVAVLWRAGA